MWSLILTGYLLVLLGLITTATLVATLSTNHRHGTRAHTVLRTLLGASGLVALIIRLHSSGLL